MIILTIFLVLLFLTNSLISAMRRSQKSFSKKEIHLLGNRFFYRPLHAYFLPHHEYESLFFSILVLQSALRFVFVYLFTLKAIQLSESIQMALRYQCILLFFIGVLLVIGSEFVPRLVGSKWPKNTIRFSLPTLSPFLIIIFPITYLLVRLSQSFFRSVVFEVLHEPHQEAKEELYEIVQESDLDEKLNPEEKKMFESMVTFKDLIAREVMVPRIHLFALPLEITIEEATSKILQEGYSRVPIYSSNIDNIQGLLMYKDLLAKFSEAKEKNNPALLQGPILPLLKPALFAPEAKKISLLLQEFKRKQMHMAIIVDEYGGTEGIVTIEDLLEVLVGEIEDEYDETTKEGVVKLPDGSFVLDASTSLLDLQENFGIDLPEDGDYDTLGGYIFEVAGEIPEKGFQIVRDEFELEVLKADRRKIFKVKIKPKRKKGGDWK